MSSVTGNSDNIFINNANLKIAKAGKGLMFSDGTIMYTAPPNSDPTNTAYFSNGINAFIITETTANTGFAGNTAPTDAISVSSNLFISYTGNLITYGQVTAGSVANVESNILTLESDLSDNSSRIGLYESNVYLYNGSVGIGTSTPDADANLEVSGNLWVTSTASGSTAHPEFVLYRNNTTDAANGNYLGQIKFKGKNDAGSPQDINYAKISAKIGDVTAGTEDGLLEFAFIKNGSQNIGGRFTSSDLKLINGTGLQVDGSVGIGTTTPDELLHIYEDSTNEYQIKLQNIGTGAAGITLESNTHYLRLIAQDNDTSYVTVNGSGGLAFFNGSGDYNWFGAGSALKMKLNNSGNLGIGTNSPTANLHVVGNVFTTSNIELTDDNFIYNGSGSSLRLKSNAGVQIDSYVNNTDPYTVNGSKIGLYNNNMYLDADNIYFRKDAGTPNYGIFSDGNLQLYSSGAEGGQIRFYDSQSTANFWTIDNDAGSSLRAFRNVGAAVTLGFEILDSGNMGVGSSSPTEKLDVEGNIRCNQNGYVGGGNGTTTAYAALNFNSLSHPTRCKIVPSINVSDSFSFRDNQVDLGSASYRFNTIYAGTGTINTSDRTLKMSEADINAAELRVASNISTMFKTFKFKQAYEDRGENARKHIGVIAQDIGDALTAEGLDKSKYAFYCEDQIYRENGTNVHIDMYWQEVSNVQNYIINENPSQEPNWEQVHDLSSLPNVHTITRYGIRYSELLCFVCQSFSDKLSSFESRLAALENNNP